MTFSKKKRNGKRKEMGPFYCFGESTYQQRIALFYVFLLKRKKRQSDAGNPCVTTAKANQKKRNPQNSKAGSSLLFEDKKNENKSANTRKGPENPRKPWAASKEREMNGGS